MPRLFCLVCRKIVEAPCHEGETIWISEVIREKDGKILEVRAASAREVFEMRTGVRVKRDR